MLRTEVCLSILSFSFMCSQYSVPTDISVDSLEYEVPRLCLCAGSEICIPIDLYSNGQPGSMALEVPSLCLRT